MSSDSGEIHNESLDLWTTQEVAKYSGYTNQRILAMVKEGKIPYIPGRPHKFMPAKVKEAFIKMQCKGIKQDRVQVHADI